MVVAVVAAGGATAALAAAPATRVFVIDRVVDGDTVYLTNGAKIRLVQIDTPEVFFGVECWGRESSAATKKLLPRGTAVRLTSEPATDSVDQYGRLLRYVTRAKDDLNVNLSLVAHGNATPYFYAGREGRYAARLTRLATSARAKRLGLWRACPRTPVDFDRGIKTGTA